METILNQVEFDILNAILPKIDPHAPFFNIASLYAPILQGKYPLEVNGVVTGLYDKSIREHSKAFENVTKFLIEQEFAIQVIPPSSIYVDLRLTNKGEVLWAYGDHWAFYKSTIKSHESEIKRRVEEIISLAFNYGEFAIEPSEVKKMVINIEISNEDEAKVIIDKALSGKEEIIQLHELAKIDEEAIAYLVQEGFAENRHDIKGGKAKIYRQLTDRGRKLKGLRSIELFTAWEEKEKEEEIKNIKTEREFIQKQNEFIEINKDFTSKQSDLIQSQLYINRITRITNILISIFTGAAALWYLRNLSKNIILDYYPKYPGSTELSDIALNYLNGVTTVIFLLEIVAILRIFQVQHKAGKISTT